MKKQIAAILATGLLLLLPIYAAADSTPGSPQEYSPIDVAAAREGDTLVLTMLYEVPKGVRPQDFVEANPVYDGLEYTLREIRSGEEDEEGDSQEAEKSLTISSASDQLEEILRIMPPTMTHAEDGYSGTLVLDTGSIQVEPESSGSFSFPVQETMEYSGLDRNDPSYITNTIEKDGLTLELIHIDWRTDSAINSLVAPTYSATAYYAGTTTVERATSYRVSATYSGTVSAESSGMVQHLVVYEHIPGAGVPAAAPSSSGQASEPTPNEASSNSETPPEDDGDETTFLDLLLQFKIGPILIGIAVVTIAVFFLILRKVGARTRKRQRQERTERKMKQARSRDREREIPLEFVPFDEDRYGAGAPDTEEYSDDFVQSVQDAIKRDQNSYHPPLNRTGGRRKPEALEYLRRDGGAPYGE